ncbi:MAG: N-6 DNA methylase, partial [Epsilonproteobacteria bacterium]|nr:N-6 DNA methylase [Campylobacterota bacterium]
MSNHQLFQYSVLDEFVNKQDENLIKQRWEKFQNFLSKQEYIENVKEEKYQDGFLKDIFEECLGYTLDSTNPNSYNLEREKKNKIDGKKADGAIVIDNHVVGIIELKGQNTKELDKKGSREQSTVDQAFGYLYSHDSKYAKYVIVSNFNEVRFYIKDKTDYERFFLFQMKYEEFKKFHTILSYESIKAQIPLQIKEKSVTFEVDISNKFYKDYTKFRTELFENIIKNNPNKDQYNLLNATQKLIDRIVFILFGEDTGLLPLNTIPTIIKEYKEQRLTDYSLYDVYKIYFQAIDKGNSRLEIDRYNGGLFASDDYLDSLIIDSEVLDTQAKILSAYKFGNDISVNILGHIFEQSISDLEEITAQIENKSFDKRESKRKKDGVFYTPAYITKYIVDNTLGKLCEEKKKELDIIDIEIKKGTRAITKDKINKNLESYKEWLLSLKILDPACGSGAFLNQALEFLIEEHNQLQREFAKLGNILFTYEVEKSILENNLYGVDINTGAVEIAKLSLWLRTASRGRSLTSLADKIKVGNSLIDDKSVVDNAFVWEEKFSEVFEQGGFDVVIGNPPYVSAKNLNKKHKKYFAIKYKTAKSQYDLYTLFIEQGLSIIKNDKYLSYIIPNKFLVTDYGKFIRELLIKKTNLVNFKDLSNKNIFEDASVYPVIIVLKKLINDNPISIGNNELLSFFGFKEKDMLIEKVESINTTITLDVWRPIATSKNIITDDVSNTIVSNGEINRFFINQNRVGTLNKFREKDIQKNKILIKKLCYNL